MWTDGKSSNFSIVTEERGHQRYLEKKFGLSPSHNVPNSKGIPITDYPEQQFAGTLPKTKVLFQD